MNTLTFEPTNGEPSASDKQALVAGMLAHHASQGHPRHTDVYSLFVKNGEKQPIAGIIVSFLWNGMSIDSLWVNEAYRGQGIGRTLMEQVEKEALSRGCDLAYTNTFTWQAAGFYRKLGYTQYGKLENFPPGNELTYVQKRLTR